MKVKNWIVVYFYNGSIELHEFDSVKGINKEFKKLVNKDGVRGYKIISGFLVASEWREGEHGVSESDMLPVS